MIYRTSLRDLSHGLFYHGFGIDTMTNELGCPFYGASSQPSPQGQGADGVPIHLSSPWSPITKLTICLIEGKPWDTSLKGGDLSQILLESPLLF